MYSSWLANLDDIVFLPGLGAPCNLVMYVGLCCSLFIIVQSCVDHYNIIHASSVR